MTYRTKDERHIALPFMRVPSQEQRPDYYRIISSPIDLQTVQNKIDQGQYTTMESFMLDLRMIWHNAIVVFEKGSRISLDADILRRQALKLQRSFNPLSEPGDDGGETTSHQPQQGKEPVSFPSLIISNQSLHWSAKERAMIQQFLQIFDYLKNIRTNANRRLCDVLIRVPPQTENSEYVRLFQSPLDIATIVARVKGNKYPSIKSFVLDMVTMFENALLSYRNNPAYQVEIGTVYQVGSQNSCIVLILMILCFQHFRNKMRSDFVPTELLGLFWLERETKVLWQVLMSVVNALFMAPDDANRRFLFEGLLYTVRFSNLCNSSCPSHGAPG